MPVESATETEQPEVVQRVQSVLRSHFNEDELPTEASHCLAIAAVDEVAWIDIVEVARERSAKRDSDPKIQDFRDAAKGQSWQHQRKLADRHGVLAMQALDELNSLKPNPTRHGTAMKQIQAFLDELKGWQAVEPEQGSPVRSKPSLTLAESLIRSISPIVRQLDGVANAIGNKGPNYSNCLIVC